MPGIFHWAGCCCEGPAPGECPPGLADRYRIALYVNGDLTGCGDCLPFAGIAWQGTVGRDGPECAWDGWASEPLASEIDGKAAGGAHLELDEGNCKWTFMVWCLGEHAEPITMWAGEKLTGATPVGTYTWTSGCDDTGQVEIEECP